MFKTIVEAGLPLVAVHTRDTLNLVEVLKELTGRDAVHMEGIEVNKSKPEMLFYYICPENTHPSQFPNFDPFYKVMVQRGATLLIVNHPAPTMAMFNGGELPVPKTLVSRFFESVFLPEEPTEKDKENAKKIATGLMPALGGTTVKETAELGRLTMTRDKGLTMQGLLATRREYFQGQQGLTLVDAAQTFYQPKEELATWIKRERQFFLSGNDMRLRPRGLLFDGPPGVGKTAGAKYVSEQWGVPLYRIDVGTTKDKYIGNSENNLALNFSRLDQEEPCIVLLDEVEKVFDVTHSDLSGTNSSMMSQMLWWLAEHRSRVLVLMTTNAVNKIPKELYRERRIDATITFEGLTPAEAVPFVEAVLKTFPAEMMFNIGDAKEVVKTCEKLVVPGKKLTQAMLTEQAYHFVKASLLKEDQAKTKLKAFAK